MAVDPNLTRDYTVTPEQFANFRTVAEQNNLTIPEGDSGVVETHGVTIAFTYDGVVKLTLNIISKPFYIPASMVWSELANYLPAPTAS